MNHYSVNVYKTLQNDSGHNFWCLQKHFRISSWDPVEALAAVQQRQDAKLWEADCIEVVNESQQPHSSQVTR